jgi:ATP-binding cassette subfamily B protein RaxB
VVDGNMSLATLGMMLLYAPMLSLLVIVALIFYLMIRLAWYRPLRALSEETIVASAKENSNFMETLRGIQSIKLFNKEPQRQVMWQNRYADTMNASIRKGKLGIIFSGMNGLLFGLENILVVYMAAKMVLAGNFTIGMLYAFMSYKSQFTSRAAALIENFIEIKMLGLHLERLSDIALEPAEKTETWHSLDKPKLNGQITLENIAFKYSDNEPEVLSGIDFTVAPGESVAIIGPSGCGKTTLMKIMMGIFKPTMGKVLIDNQPLEKFGMQAYREQFGTVMQNDQLLSGSISENITFFSQRVDEQRLKVCTKMAMIDQDIEQMPMGYNTLIGDMGAMLSGGQQQRLLLARALYKAPTVLFLDEATSHLDVALEQAVNGAVKQLNITRIIIAHRPETIASADRVVLLTAKGLIEQNT